jgi:hypothetical protein
METLQLVGCSGLKMVKEIKTVYKKNVFTMQAMKSYNWTVGDRGRVLFLKPH